MNVHFRHFIFVLTFHPTSYTPRVSQFWILITSEQLHECCFIMNPPLYIFNAPHWPSWAFLQNKNRCFPLQILRKKAFPFLDSFFISLALRIRIMKPAIPFFLHFQLIIYTYFPHVCLYSQL